MREILFRGKQVDNGEVVESGSIQQLNDGYKVYLWYQGGAPFPSMVVVMRSVQEEGRQ